MSMDKDLKYYMKLSYPIEIVNIPVDQGGGISACIPQLGRKAFRGDGETIEDALKSLEEVKEEWFRTYVENETPIPEPIVEEEDTCSGRFVLRVPKELHRYLVQRAVQNGMSLNQCTNYLLTSSAVTEGFQAVMEKCTTRFSQLVEEMQRIEYKFEGAASGHQKRRDFYLLSKSEYEKAA